MIDPLSQQLHVSDQIVVPHDPPVTYCNAAWAIDVTPSLRSHEFHKCLPALREWTWHISLRPTPLGGRDLSSREACSGRLSPWIDTVKNERLLERLKEKSSLWESITNRRDRFLKHIFWAHRISS